MFEGAFNNVVLSLLKTTPYSEIKKLKKVDIYTYELTKEQSSLIWGKLDEASKELGIELGIPNFYPLNAPERKDEFEDYINKYFNDYKDYYIEENNK